MRRPTRISVWSVAVAWLAVVCLVLEASAIDIRVNWHRNRRLRSAEPPTEQEMRALGQMDLSETTSAAEEAAYEMVQAGPVFAMYDPAKNCEGEMDSQCRSMVKDGWGVTSVARNLAVTTPDGSSATPTWTCFDPDALTMSGLAYDANKRSPNFVIAQQDLSDTLDKCLGDRGDQPRITIEQAHGCEKALTAYCRSTVTDTWGPYALARYLEGDVSRGDFGLQWRCFEPSSLAADTMSYDLQGEGVYWTRNDDMTAITIGHNCVAVSPELTGVLASSPVTVGTLPSPGVGPGLIPLSATQMTKIDDEETAAVAPALEGTAPSVVLPASHGAPAVPGAPAGESQAPVSGPVAAQGPGSSSIARKATIVKRPAPLTPVAATEVPTTATAVTPPSAANSPVVSAPVVAPARTTTVLQTPGSGPSVKANAASASDLTEAGGEGSIDPAVLAGLSDAQKVSTTYPPAKGCGLQMDKFCRESVTEDWKMSAVARLSPGADDVGDGDLAWRCYEPGSLNSAWTEYDETKNTKEYISFSTPLLDELEKCTRANSGLAPVVPPGTLLQQEAIQKEMEELKAQVRQLKDQQMKQEQAMQNVKTPVVPVSYSKAKGCDEVLNGMCRGTFAYRPWGASALARFARGSTKLGDQDKYEWRCYAIASLQEGNGGLVDYNLVADSTDYESFNTALTAGLNKCLASRADAQVKFAPAHGCDLVLSTWCRKSMSYGWGAVSIARLLPGTGPDAVTSEWRCYEPRALTSDTEKYDAPEALTSYSTHHGAITGILEKCVAGEMDVATIEASTQYLSTYGPSKDCDGELNSFCRERVQASWGALSVARKLAGNTARGDAAHQWRCYSPDSLAGDTLSYDASKQSTEYETLDGDIEHHLDICLGTRGAIVEYPDAKGCDHTLNMWCRDNVKSHWGDLALARFAVGSSDLNVIDATTQEWRCYEPSALTSDTLDYDGPGNSQSYWVNQEDLNAQLVKCQAARKFGVNTAAPVAPHNEATNTGIPRSYGKEITLRSQTAGGPYLYDGNCGTPRATSEIQGPHEVWTFENPAGPTLPGGSVLLAPLGKVMLVSKSTGKRLNTKGGCSADTGLGKDDESLTYEAVDAASGLIQLQNSAGEYLAVDSEGNIIMQAQAPFTWFVSLV